MMRTALTLCLLSAQTAFSAPVNQVACVGDSITIGFFSSATMNPWCQLSSIRRVGTNFGTANVGVGGMRCDQLETGNSGAFTAFARLTSQGYTRVVIMCGANDLLQSRTADQIYGTGDTVGTRGPWLRMVRAAQAAGLAVTVMTVTPLGGASGYTAGPQAEHTTLNSRIRATSGVVVVDAYRALAQTTAIATALATDPGANASIAGAYTGTPSDGIHPGVAGQSRLADAIDATAGALP